MRPILGSLSVVTLLLAWTSAPPVLGLAQEPGPIGIPMFRTKLQAASWEVDGAGLSIVYGPPTMRGEKIFGGLVPYDRIWCPGADVCTRFTTDRDLQFAGLKLQAGEYSLWILPTETVWTLTFNSNSRSARQARYNPTLDVGRTALQKRSLPSPVEQLTFSIEANKPGAGGVITMAWETTHVSAPFTVAR